MCVFQYKSMVSLYTMNALGLLTLFHFRLQEKLRLEKLIVIQNVSRKLQTFKTGINNFFFHLNNFFDIFYYSLFW